MRLSQIIDPTIIKTTHPEENGTFNCGFVIYKKKDDDDLLPIPFYVYFVILE